MQSEASGEIEISVSEFVGLLNQTLEYAYPSVVIVGELANFRVSKNRWVYFDLQDKTSSVKFFGTVYQLPGPLEDGMLLKVRGQPRLHDRYGFSVNILSIQPAGEGSLRRAAELLKAQLAAEGLFNDLRKRPLPYPPQRIGLITSSQAAAYSDFTKILNDRWRGIEIEFVNVQVQGDAAIWQITQAFERLNEGANSVEVIILIRGGGSAEDLAAFNSEPVTRAVAASRIPTLVAIGHEVDLSLAELAADRRASTPSNAAEILVPDRKQALAELAPLADRLRHTVQLTIKDAWNDLAQQSESMEQTLKYFIAQAGDKLMAQQQLLAALSPKAVLQRGYAVVRLKGQALRSVRRLSSGAIVEVEISDGRFTASVDGLKTEI